MNKINAPEKENQILSWRHKN